MTDKSIDEEACRLFNDSKISSRYKELQDKLENAAIMTAKQRLEYLTGIIRNTEREQGEVPADLNTKIRAIDIMNKMQGEYVTKIEGDISVRKLEDLI